MRGSNNPRKSQSTPAPSWREEKIQALVQELAAVKGLSIDELLKSFVLASIEVPRLPSPNGDHQTKKPDGRQKGEAFEAWANRFARDVPPLSQEAISRSAIYDQD